MNYGPYDYSSVMHYGKVAFPVLGTQLQTIRGKVHTKYRDGLKGGPQVL